VQYDAASSLATFELVTSVGNMAVFQASVSPLQPEVDVEITASLASSTLTCTWLVSAGGAPGTQTMSQTVPLDVGGFGVQAQGFDTRFVGLEIFAQ
jgi:hypothetical protein